MNATKQDTIIAPLADTHCGSTVGLLPRNWTGADGGTLKQSKGQKILWAQFKECAQEIKHQRKGKRLIIPVMGDAIEGKHHGTTQIHTPNPNEQARMFTANLEYFLDEVGFDHRKGDILLFVRGTDIHVGDIEEEIARDFTDPKTGKPIPLAVTEGSQNNFYKDGRYVHDHLVLNVNGVLFDLAHHGLGIGLRAWTKKNGIKIAMMNMYIESYLPPAFELPRYVWRAHLHQYVTDEYEDEGGAIRGTILPAFQLKTHFGHRVASLKRIAYIGMIYAEVNADGTSRQVDDLVKKFDSTKVYKV